MKSISADLDKLLRKGSIDNELEFEEASIIDRKLRVMAKEKPKLDEKRQALPTILKAYESRVWVNTQITDEKFEESDLAESIAEQERKFLYQRKELIRKKLQLLSPLLPHTSQLVDLGR